MKTDSFQFYSKFSEYIPIGDKQKDIQLDPCPCN